jgi:hypothetical protein
VFVTCSSSGTRPAGGRGQILALFALFLVVLLGFTALAVDYGTYLLARREYQNVADAGALAGTSYLTRPVSSAKQDLARQAAWEAVKSKLGLSATMPSAAQLSAGYTTAGWTIWIATPPTDAGAAYPGDASISGGNSVFVRVDKDNPAFLSRMFGISDRTIRGWATAGQQPSRWAVIALCPRNGSCPSTVESVRLSGTNTILKVIDGDLGGNWGFKVDSNSGQLQLPADSKAYLVDTACGPSRYLCYPDPANVNDGAGNAKRVQVLPAPIEDPNYPLPSWIDDTTTSVPWRGDANHDVTIANGSGIVQNASGTNVGCGPSSPRIGPGRYRDLDIRANSCVILDPTLGLAAGQRPGIFVITRNFNIGNASFVIGDGVTVFWTSTANPFNPSGGIVLDSGNANISGIPAGAEKFGAWTTLGTPTWSAATGTFPTATTTWTTPTGRETGIAFYVRKSSGSATNIFNMAGTSPLMFRGILYGPTDNVNVSGAGTQAAVGRIIGWTVRYNGNTTITQVYDGPDEARAYLLEPRTGQPD